MSEKLQVLYFSAPWCGPCKMFKPAFEDVVKSFDNEIDVHKIDIDSDKNTPAQYNINSIPTIVMVKDGAILFRKVGVMSKLQLTEEIEKHT
jgi:thioredoxin 1